MKMSHGWTILPLLLSFSTVQGEFDATLSVVEVEQIENLQISWQTQQGLEFRIDTTQDLQVDWQELRTVVGDGSIWTENLGAIDGLLPRRFYRIVQFDAAGEESSTIVGIVTPAVANVVVGESQALRADFPDPRRSRFYQAGLWTNA